MIFFSLLVKNTHQSEGSGYFCHLSFVFSSFDFYLNHYIHVNKGIGYATCHGRVDRMPLVWKVNTLQMEWCLDCHRQPEKYVRPRDQVFNLAYEPEEDQMEMGNRLVAEYKIQKLTNCWTCHR